MYVGTGTLYIQDNVTGQNAGLTVANGVLQISGANQLQVGQLKFVNNTIESTSTTLNIQLGQAGDTGNFTVNRNVAISSSNNLTFGYGGSASTQTVAFNSSTAVTSIIAGTGTYINTSTGAVTISSTMIRPVRTVGNTATVIIDFSKDQLIFAGPQSQNLGVSFTNYTTGSIVRMVVAFDSSGGPAGHKITLGTNTGNSTIAGATQTAGVKSQIIYLEYFCLDGTVTNTYVSVSYN